jgi:hypothetical protein
MQNHIVILCVANILRLLRAACRQVQEWFVLPQNSSGRPGLVGFLLSTDLDSARLDVVSRSLWWGCGAPTPKPVPVTICSPIAAPVRSRWRGGPPEMLPRWDH